MIRLGLLEASTRTHTFRRIPHGRLTRSDFKQLIRARRLLILRQVVDIQTQGIVEIRAHLSSPRI